jgi:hypothetical protein
MCPRCLRADLRGALAEYGAIRRRDTKPERQVLAVGRSATASRSYSGFGSSPTARRGLHAHAKAPNPRSHFRASGVREDQPTGTDVLIDREATRQPTPSDLLGDEDRTLRVIAHLRTLHCANRAHGVDLGRRSTSGYQRPSSERCMARPPTLAGAGSLHRHARAGLPPRQPGQTFPASARHPSSRRDRPYLGRPRTARLPFTHVTIPERECAHRHALGPGGRSPGVTTW